ncbi:MAG: ribokinase [Terriglobia bacterium]
MSSVPRIAVVGSYAAGLTMNMQRLPAPGETQLGSGYRFEHGGKGSNQAVGCARLGAAVHFVARIGTDAFGDMALNLYQQEGIDAAAITRMPDPPTGVGFIMVESTSGHNLISLDPGANGQLCAQDVLNFERDLSSCQVLLTQLEIPVTAAATALACARSQGVVAILNPAPATTLPDDVLRSASILTPNESEARILAGLPAGAPSSEEEIARKLMARGAGQVVITLGEKGALVATPQSMLHIAAIPVRAVDTTGAGDAFNAGLAVALACGATLEAAAQFAVVAGGLAVTKQGVVPSLPRLREVLEFYGKSGWPTPEWMRTVTTHE